VRLQAAVKRLEARPTRLYLIPGLFRRPPRRQSHSVLLSTDNVFSGIGA